MRKRLNICITPSFTCYKSNFKLYKFSHLRIDLQNWPQWYHFIIILKTSTQHVTFMGDKMLQLCVTINYVLPQPKMQHLCVIKCNNNVWQLIMCDSDVSGTLGSLDTTPICGAIKILTPMFFLPFLPSFIFYLLSWRVTHLRCN